MKLSGKISAATCVLLVMLLIALLGVGVATAVDSYKSVSKTAVIESNDHPRFQRVIKDNYSALRVYVDTETNVMYLIRSDGGGACVMVDADGNPLLWDGGTTK